MTAPSCWSEKDNQGQATGAWSTGRVLAWVFAGMAIVPVAGLYGGFGPEIAFWKALAGAAALGIVSVGFYRGKGGRAFDKIADAVSQRAGG